jgi:hypothetical protein
VTEPAPAAADAAEVLPVEPVESPAPTISPAVVARTFANGAPQEVAALSPLEAEILKVFWERNKMADAPIAGRWAFRLGPESKLQPMFQAAVELLRAAGWVSVGPRGGVVLTTAGAAFSAAHAAELEAMPVPAWAKRLLLPDFDRLSPSARNILKTLADHQAIVPDQPPKRWGFRAQPGSPTEPAFLAGAAELQSYGIVAVGQKQGLVMLTSLGDTYCRGHAAAIAAQPARPRDFRPLAPANGGNP